MGKTRSRRTQKLEPLIKVEGKISDNDEVYEQFEEVKWMEWCENLMIGEERTLKRLQKLQTTSADLPKEKVLLKIRRYLNLLGKRIDQIVYEHERDPHKQDRIQLVTGDRLCQIYTKLKQEHKDEVGLGSSHINGHHDLQRQCARFKGLKNNNNSRQTAEPGLKAHDPVKFEAWKRRKRAETDGLLEAQGHFQKSLSTMARDCLRQIPWVYWVLQQLTADNIVMRGSTRCVRVVSNRDKAPNLASGSCSLVGEMSPDDAGENARRLFHTMGACHCSHLLLEYILAHGG